MARLAKDGLTSRQRKFAHEFHATGNAKQSAITAGYSERSADVTGSRLLDNVNVVNEIGRLEAKAAQRYNITVDKLVAMSYAVHDSAMEGQVMLDRYGNATSTVKRDHSAANKAIENIARLTGHMVERKDVTVKSVDDMTEAELRAELARTEEEIAKARGNDVIKVDDLSEVPFEFQGTVMLVNDHGNVTCYSADNGRYSELWSCV